MNTWELTTQLQSETFRAVVLSISFCSASAVIKIVSAKIKYFGFPDSRQIMCDTHENAAS